MNKNNSIGINKIPLHLSGILYESIADAEGVSCVLFVSGCKHQCKDCHSPTTWDFNNGKAVDDEMIQEINNEIDKRPFLSALVLSGGDPMYQPINVINLLKKIHIPNNNIWIYSGFTMEEIQRNDEMKMLLDKCNVLVDGRFEIDKRDITLDFRGSSNQHIWKKTDNNKWQLVE